MRLVVLLVFEGAAVLDVAGPLQVFLTASEAARADGAQPPYEVLVVGSEHDPRRHGGVVSPSAQTIGDLTNRAIDTLLVAGGDPGASGGEPGATRWIAERRACIRRIGSISTGVFLLAQAGVLDGRRATTHWASETSLQDRHPAIDVKHDVLFVEDGGLWTSAGAAAGMDMALAMVEHDCGPAIAFETARRLVMFHRRSGDQPQISSQLKAQAIPNDNLRRLTDWIYANPSAALDNVQLARRANMSVRTLFRTFHEHLQTTPREFVERVRLDAARNYLEQSGERIDHVARKAGFATTEAMRRAFQRNFQVSPLCYRERHGRTDRWAATA